MPVRLRRFFGELKRRKVYHVAVVYVVVGWGVITGAQFLFQEAFGLPRQAWILVASLVVLGLPIAMVLAWAHEVKPEVGVGEAALGRSPEGGRPFSEPVPSALPRDRIAVLPFASIHSDREHDYFSDGITEELISAISRIRGLDVIARTSVIRYKDSDTRIAEIGQELNVGVVLEGSVRKAGDQLRVTVQLIDAESEGHLWAEDYDREFREIFSVQRDVATHVAEALRLRLITPDAERIGKRPTDDLAAYDLYLLGRHHLNRRLDEGTRKAISSFEGSLELDPSFALAHAGLADAYLLGALGYMSEPPANVLRRAQEHARTAIDAEDGLSEAHTSLGYSALLAWDIRTARKELCRAIELNPSSAQAHQWMAHLYVWLDRPEDGKAEWARALELDPLSAVLTTEYGWAYQYAWDYEQALVHAEKALAMDPDLFIAHFNRADNLQKLGRYDEAFLSFKRALELFPGQPMTRCFFGAALARGGRAEEAEGILAEVTEEDSDAHPISTFVAVLQEALGRKDEALASLRRAKKKREPMAPIMGTAWLPFPSLRDSAEFKALRAEIDEMTGR